MRNPCALAHLALATDSPRSSLPSSDIWQGGCSRDPIVSLRQRIDLLHHVFHLLLRGDPINGLTPKEPEMDDHRFPHLLGPVGIEPALHGHTQAPHPAQQSEEVSIDVFDTAPSSNGSGNPPCAELASPRFGSTTSATRRSPSPSRQVAHPKEIQELCGHRSITTTLNVYGHLFESLQQRLAERLDDAFRAARAPYLPPGAMENVLPLRRGADKMPSDQDFSEWGGLDSNQRPTDYESAALTN